MYNVPFFVDVRLSGKILPSVNVISGRSAACRPQTVATRAAPINARRCIVNS